MERPWEAEHEVSESTARALIRAQFPTLAPVRLQRVGAGWDNTVFRVNDTLVFRFPRRQLAVELLENEARALGLLTEHLPLPVPTPLHHGAPGATYPWPFLGYRWLPGETGCRADLTPAERTELAAPLGAFLAALHAVSTDPLRRAGVGHDTLGRLELPKRTQQIEERLHQAERLGLVRDAGAWRWIHADLPQDWRPGTETLVHGDFYSRHVLIDAARRVCGVIDWGDVHLGDPALDLSIGPGFLPLPARAAFREAYGPISTEAWRMARMKALHNAVHILIYGHDIGDDALVREGRTALEHVLQE